MIIALVLTGCIGGSSGVAKASTKPKEEAPKEPNRLDTNSGSGTVREPDGNRHVLYTVKWESSQLDYTLKDGALNGTLRQVSGELYQEGKLASRFVADAARADKAKGQLVLSGKVTVIGLDPQAKLECQKLEWKTKEKRIRALGGVTIRFNQGTIGPMDELWCLPDLKIAGTPGFSP